MSSPSSSSEAKSSEEPKLVESKEEKVAAPPDSEGEESSAGSGGDSDGDSNDDSDDDDDADGDGNDFESSEDEEDDAVFQELVGLKRPMPGDSTAGSSKRTKGEAVEGEEEEEECMFVPDANEEIDMGNVIPRAKRSAAVRSGLVVQENKFAHLEDNDSEGEADF